MDNEVETIVFVFVHVQSRVVIDEVITQFQENSVKYSDS